MVMSIDQLIRGAGPGVGERRGKGGKGEGRRTENGEAEQDRREEAGQEAA